MCIGISATAPKLALNSPNIAKWVKQIPQVKSIYQVPVVELYFICSQNDCILFWMEFHFRLSMYCE